jgi:hypothetical protein
LPLIGTAIGGMRSRVGQFGRQMMSTVPVLGSFTRGTTQATTATTRATTQVGRYTGSVRALGAPVAQTTVSLGRTATAAGGVATGLARAGAGIGQFLGPIGIAASVGLIAADSLGLLTSSSDKLEEKLSQGLPLLQQTNSALEGTKGTALGLKLQIEQLAPALAKGGEAGRQAALAIRGSWAPIKQTIQEAKVNAEQFWDELGGSESFEDFKDDVTVYGEHGEALGNLGKLADDYGVNLDELGASIHANGKITQDWRRQLEGIGVEGQAIDDLNASLKPMRDNLDQVRAANARLTTSMAMMARAQRGQQATLGANASRAVQGLQKTFSRQQIIRFSVQADTRRAQTDLLTLANQSRRLGATPAQIKAIMLGDGSVRSKLQALESLKNKLKQPALFQVAANVARALSDMGNVEGQKSRVKQPVSTTVTANVSGALSAIASVIAAAANIPRSITQVVNVVTRHSGSPAKGGRTGGTLTTHGINKVSDDAPGFATGGGFISRPMFVVGEEAPRHPEFVIATNPAYRQDNLSYWMQAGQMLGITAADMLRQGVPGFKKGKGKKKPGPKIFRIGGLPLEEAEQYLSHAQNKLQKWRDRYAQAHPKHPGKGNPPDRLTDEVKLSQRRVAEAKQFNAVVRQHENQMASQQSLMELASATGQMDQWQNAHGRYADIGTSLKAILDAAIGSKWSKGVYESELESKRDALRVELQANDVALPELLSADEQTRLAWLEANRDVAATTVTNLEDDVAANAALVDFWTRKLAFAQESGIPQFISEAAQALSAAQSATTGAQQAVQTQETNFSTARYDLFRDLASNVSWSLGQIGSFNEPAPGTMSGGSTVTVTNNYSAPPPDPHTWSQQQAYELSTMGV